MICQTWCDYFIRDNIPYPQDSIEYKRSVIAKLISLLALLVLAFDIYNNLSNAFATLALLEVFGIGILLVNYILFHLNKLELTVVSTVIVGVLSFLAIVSLHIEGFGKESALFWTASLPIYVFAQNGLKRGVYWSVVNTIGIVAVTLLSALDIGMPIFSPEVLIQMIIGYGAISFIVYYFEKIRYDYEERLAKTAREREVLLKELHHRVKNNMQVMIGLLWLQAEDIDEPKYKQLFQENIDRLRAMSIVHESLYKVNDFEEIDMYAYLTMLGDNLRKVTKQELECRCDALELDMKSALGIGLIVNECVTNAIKYAYEEEKGGTIAIALEQREDGRYRLSVEDQGKGFAEGVKMPEGIGMMLIEDMVKSLENGEYSVVSDHGVTVTVTFDKRSHHVA